MERRVGWENACEVVSRRPPISLLRIVARTEGYTYDPLVWGLSLVQGPFSVGPCQTPMDPIRNVVCTPLSRTSRTAGGGGGGGCAAGGGGLVRRGGGGVGGAAAAGAPVGGAAGGARRWTARPRPTGFAMTFYEPSLTALSMRLLHRRQLLHSAHRCSTSEARRDRLAKLA
jgi:hypothetical protein